VRYFLRFSLLVCCSLLVACSTPGMLQRMSQSFHDLSTKVAAATDHMPAFLFDRPAPGTPDPGDAPVVRPPRRVPFIDPAIEEMKKAIALAEARAKEPPPANWVEMFKRLPKDDEDNIDWMAALTDKIITPSGQYDPEVADVGKTEDFDVELSTSGKPKRMVVFSHESHTKWLTCTNCHPVIFKKEAGTAKITMDAIDNGKYCGVCHDKVAIAQPSGCKGCHRVKKKKS